LEYQQFKEIADQLREFKLLGRDTFIRGASSDWLEFAEGFGLEQVSIFQLVEAFRQMLKEAPEDVVHEITLDRISVRQRILEIMDFIRGRDSVTFRELFEAGATRSRMIVTFLAILELVRIAVLKMHQDSEFGSIRMFPAVAEEAGAIEERIKDDYV
jgi:segregation and condensation protein A